MNRSNFTQQGFTLISLVTTMTLVAISTSVAMPSMNRLVASSRFTNTIDHFYTSLQYARTEAIKLNNKIVLCPIDSGGNCRPATSWRHGWLVFIDNNNNRQPDSGEPLLYRQTLSNNVHIYSTKGRKSIRYLPSGRADGSNITITFCDKDNLRPPKAIIISNVGRARFADRKTNGKHLYCPKKANG